MIMCISFLKPKFFLTFAVLFFLLGTTWLQTQRTDIVILKNGDKITEEIRKLEFSIQTREKKIGDNREKIESIKKKNFLKRLLRF